jgi:hypothetical protein
MALYASWTIDVARGLNADLEPTAVAADHLYVSGPAVYLRDDTRLRVREHNSKSVRVKVFGRGRPC